MTDDEIVASWHRSSGDVQYALTHHVDESVRKGAEAGRNFASVHLGLEPPPTMRFYTPETPAERAYRREYGGVEWLSFKGSAWNGHADKWTKTIGVRADIDPELAVEVAAHEVFHLTQPKGDAGRDTEPEEAAAQAYGQWVADALLDERGRLTKVHFHDGYPYGGETLARQRQRPRLPRGAAVVSSLERRATHRHRGTPSRPARREPRRGGDLADGRARRVRS